MSILSKAGESTNSLMMMKVVLPWVGPQANFRDLVCPTSFNGSTFDPLMMQ